MLIDNISFYVTEIFHKGFVPLEDMSECDGRGSGIERDIQERGEFKLVLFFSPISDYTISLYSYNSLCLIQLYLFLHLQQKFIDYLHVPSYARC